MRAIMSLDIDTSCHTTLEQPVECIIAACTTADWKAGFDLQPWCTGATAAQIGDSGEFNGASGQTLLLHGGAKNSPRLLLLGLGDSADTTALRTAAATAVQQLRQRKLTSFAFDLSRFPAMEQTQLGDLLLDAALLECYRFERYKNSADTSAPVRHCLLCGANADELDALRQQMERRRTITAAVWLARDLVNEPGNVKNPQFLAQIAWEAARDCHGLSCNIMGEEQLRRHGFNALLAVARGSDNPPRLIELEYRGGSDDTPPIALVGKGVTFDSGGISLKPGEGMDQMKMDMAGGAAVIATLVACARLRLPVNIVGVIPAVENMPSAHASRPGDIVTALNGKSIEILNTDAEGRLILADAISWVARRQPRHIIDIATLTGACIIALGHHASAVLGSDEQLLAKLRAAGEATGERLWPLPLFKEYRDQLKSSAADIKNIGGRPAGTITAAAFLQEFTAEHSWAHLDIAGTAWEEKGRPGYPVGASGCGVRLLVDYLSKSCAAMSVANLTE